MVFTEVLGKLAVGPERLAAERLFVPGELLPAFDGHRAGGLSFPS